MIMCNAWSSIRKSVFNLHQSWNSQKLIECKAAVSRTEPSDVLLSHCTDNMLKFWVFELNIFTLENSWNFSLSQWYKPCDYRHLLATCWTKIYLFMEHLDITFWTVSCHTELVRYLSPVVFCSAFVFQSMFNSLMSFFKENEEVPQVETHWMSESGIIDVFVMLGPKPHDVFQEYASFTGTTGLPPVSFARLSSA